MYSGQYTNSRPLEFQLPGTAEAVHWHTCLPECLPRLAGESNLSGLTTELGTYTDSAGTVYTPICDGCDGVKVCNPGGGHSVGGYVLDKSPCDHIVITNEGGRCYNSFADNPATSATTSLHHGGNSFPSKMLQDDSVVYGGSDSFGTRMVADGKVISVLEPRPQIAKASPSHFVLACNALALASVQGALSGDMRGKKIQDKAAANAAAVSPMGAYLLRKAFAAAYSLEFNIGHANQAAGDCSGNPDNMEELGDLVRQLTPDKSVAVINIRELNIIADLHLKNMCDTSILEFKRG